MTALPVKTIRDPDIDKTAQAISANPGLLKDVYVNNPNATIEHIHFYDKATGDVTVGTTVPKMTYGIPVSGVLNLRDLDINFTVACTIAATVEADAGSTDPATGLVGTIVYRDD